MFLLYYKIEDALKALSIPLALILFLSSHQLLDAAENTEDRPPTAPRTGWSTSVFPVAFYSTKTGFAGGLGSVLTYRRASRLEQLRPLSFPLIGFYTSKNQVFAAVAPQLYFGEIDWELSLEASYSNVPDEFYGIGDQTTDADREEFTLESTAFGFSLLRRVYGGLRFGVLYEAERINVLENQSGGLLDGDLVVGSRGGWTSGGGATLMWDDRDNVFYPSRGGWYQITAALFRESLGSDYEFETVTVDLRHYLTIAGDHIAALQFLSLEQWGTVPFYQLPTLGEFMRGIRTGRFQDKALTTAQIEYRFPIVGRLSGTLFSAFGDVASSLEAFRLRDGKISGGVGLRFATDKVERVNMRFDIGFSDWGVQPIIRFQEAF